MTDETKGEGRDMSENALSKVWQVACTLRLLSYGIHDEDASETLHLLADALEEAIGGDE